MTQIIPDELRKELGDSFSDKIEEIFQIKNNARQHVTTNLDNYIGQYTVAIDLEPLQRALREPTPNQGHNFLAKSFGDSASMAWYIDSNRSSAIEAYLGRNGRLLMYIKFIDTSTWLDGAPDLSNLVQLTLTDESGSSRLFRIDKYNSVKVDFNELGPNRYLAKLQPLPK